ncbi:hypothetical protein BD779DRAFT_1680263 [Infundibulicybe gibba]|nr:hypothetical protein BD779DRAFT_1680263 [Infundibulicybe gibba]
MSSPSKSVPQDLEAASRWEFDPILLNANRRKALHEKPSDDYTSSSSKPFWRTKAGIVGSSVLAAITVAGLVIVGTKVGRNGSVDPMIGPAGITPTATSSPGGPISSFVAGPRGIPTKQPVPQSTGPPAE